MQVDKHARACRLNFISICVTLTDSLSLSFSLFLSPSLSLSLPSSLLPYLSLSPSVKVNMETNAGYMGGLKREFCANTTLPYYATSSEEVLFHVSTRMPSKGQDVEQKVSPSGQPLLLICRSKQFLAFHQPHQRKLAAQGMLQWLLLPRA